MSNCEFCDYVDFKSQVVFSTEDTFVIYPRKPVFKYHFILFPKLHSSVIHEASEKSVKDIFKTINKFVSAFGKNNDKFEGYNIFSNNGSKFVGQTVYHSHMRIFLRFSDEKNSPYAFMNGPVDIDEQTEAERAANIEEFSSIIN